MDYTQNYHFNLPPPGMVNWYNSWYDNFNEIDELIKQVKDHAEDEDNPHKTSFLKLIDSPSSYSGHAGKVLAVNSQANAIVFRTNVESALHANNADAVRGIEFKEEEGLLWFSLDEGETWTVAGEMQKSEYDTNDSGVVDDAEKLGGKTPEEYQLRNEIATGTSNFAGSGNSTTIAHGLDGTPTFVSITPSQDKEGTLGEFWVNKDSTNIIVYNTGSATTSFMWLAIL